MEIQLHTSDRISLHEYMQKSQEERQAHLDLSQPCLEIGSDSKGSRALLAVVLNTTADGLGKGNGYLCHACHNARCSNPYHHYFGTPSENCFDAIKNDPDKAARTRDAILAKNPEHYKELGRLAALRGGGHNAHDAEIIAERLYLIRHHNPKQWGFKTLASKIWGIAPQVAGRWYKKYGP